MYCPLQTTKDVGVSWRERRKGSRGHLLELLANFAWALRRHHAEQFTTSSGAAPRVRLVGPIDIVWDIAPPALEDASEAGTA